uniref:Uncharacterized protein n=2 Tax=Panagrolaimus sp. PS1159 TaxID=55785 RepID=A0AC35GTD0_9BILA
MFKTDIDEFLRVCNETIVELMHKMENFDPEKIDIVSTELRRKLLTTLLENDVITAETYSLEKEKTEEQKKEGDLEERSKLAIKKLAQQVLEKDREIEKLKFQLSQYQPNLEENDGVKIQSYRF